MNTVNSLLEGSSPYQVLQNQAAKLSGKWEKSGLLEGIESSTDANNMAILLENQAKQLVNEANTTGTGANISTGNSEAWAGVALPLVRRVFGEIVAKDLVSVQPMNLPAGLIFYLDFQYGSTGDGFTSGDSLYGASSDLKRTELPATANRKALYGAGTFGYSFNQTGSATVTLASGAAAHDTPSELLNGILNMDTQFSASKAGEFNDGNAVVRVVTVNTSSLVDFDVDAIRAISLGTGSLGVDLFPQFTRVNAGKLELVISAAANIDMEGMKVTYPITPDNLDDRGDFEEGKNASSAGGGTDGLNSTLEIPEINVQLRSDTVAAKTRKLKAQWTPEFAQDLNAYHSIDAEAELTSILSEYISMEIDLEILDMLIRNADTVEGWSAKVGEDVSVTSPSNNSVGGSNPAVTFSTETNNLGVYYTKMSWFQTLGIKLQKVSNLIHQKTLRGGANFLVVSPRVSTILESIPGFAADSAGDSDKYNMGVQKIGAINNRYTVYKNPYMTENIILMGYKGSQFLETGAVFAPYIPLIMTPLVYDPTSFTPRKGIMTRYAKKMVRPDFYGKVVIRDLDQL
jgi:hypothetical protein